MACCGTDCSITVGGETSGLHQFSINIGGEAVDVTTFDSGTAGDWLSCREDATLTVQTYVIINGISKGDTGIAWSAVVCGTTISGECTCTQIDIPVDAKGVPTLTYTFKITGTITGI